MALAIRFDQLIRDGVVSDRAELTRLATVSRPRMTQIVNLRNFASDFQEALLLLLQDERGKNPMTELELGTIVAEVNWGRQSGMWSRVLNLR